MVLSLFCNVIKFNSTLTNFRMPRTYKRKKGARSYKDYSPSKLMKAVIKVSAKKMSLRKAEEVYGDCLLKQSKRVEIGPFLLL